MLNDAVLLTASLVGFSALITLLINAAKWIGWIPDGVAPKVSAGANLILTLAVYFLKIFRPDFAIEGLDPVVAEAAAVGNMIFNYILQLGFGKLTHDTVKGLPVIGKSFTLEREQNLG